MWRQKFVEQVEPTISELRFSAHQGRLQRTCKNIEEAIFSNDLYTMAESVNGKSKRDIAKLWSVVVFLKSIKCDH